MSASETTSDQNGNQAGEVATTDSIGDAANTRPEQAISAADPTAMMQTALASFDGLRVDAAIQAGFDVRRAYLDTAKYRNALHELVLNYSAVPPAERPPKLHLKFIDILTVLLQSGVDINDADYRNQTPLHLVASSGAGGGHPEVIRALLASGARVNQPDSGQQTALHKAVLAGSRGDVQALLEGGADPNHVDNMGHSAVHVAAKRKRNAEILSQLVRRGAKASLNHPEWSRQNKGASPLHTAARLGQVDNAEALLQLGADVNVVDASGQTALHVAAVHEITGRLCTVLMRRGARTEVRDALLSEIPLHKAIRANAIDNVAALLAYGSSRRSSQIRLADVAGNTALHKAAALPSTELAVWNMLLAAEGATACARTTNCDGATVLQVAQRAHNSLALAVLRAFDVS